MSGLKNLSLRLWVRTTWSWSRTSSRSSAHSRKEARQLTSSSASWRSPTSRSGEYRSYLTTDCSALSKPVCLSIWWMNGHSLIREIHMNIIWLLKHALTVLPSSQELFVTHAYSPSWRPMILWHPKTTRLHLPAPVPSWTQPSTISLFPQMQSGWWASARCLVSTWWVWSFKELHIVITEAVFSPAINFKQINILSDLCFVCRASTQYNEIFLNYCSKERNKPDLYRLKAQKGCDVSACGWHVVD